MRLVSAARAVWHARPDLQTAAAAWIIAGGPHHTGFSQSLTTEHLEAFAEMAGVELLVIGNNTKLWDFKREIRTNEAYYQLAGGF